MHLPTALITLATAASVVFAQQAPPSPEEAEEMASAIYGDNSVFKSLVDYYSTHSFTTGTRLLSWISKMDRYETLTATDYNQEGSWQDAMDLLNNALGDFPTEEYNNLLEQYFPESILGSNGVAAIMPSTTASSAPTGSADSGSDNNDEDDETESESPSATPGASASGSRAMTSAVSADATSSRPSTTVPATTVVTSQETSSEEETDGTTSAEETDGITSAEETASPSSEGETASASSSANSAATIGYCGATFIGLFGAIVGLNVL